MEKGSQKTQAYPWICRGFLRTLDPQEIGLSSVTAIFGSICILYGESASSVFDVICIVKAWHILYIFFLSGIVKCPEPVYKKEVIEWIVQIISSR